MERGALFPHSRSCLPLPDHSCRVDFESWIAHLPCCHPDPALGLTSVRLSGCWLGPLHDRALGQWSEREMEAVRLSEASLKKKMKRSVKTAERQQKRRSQCDASVHCIWRCSTLLLMQSSASHICCNSNYEGRSVGLFLPCQSRKRRDCINKEGDRHTFMTLERVHTVELEPAGRQARQARQRLR